jgi:hypothetical protein
MKFTEIEPHIDMDLLCWRSEDGIWDLGFKRRLFGVAVCFGRAGKGDEVDYCMGTDAIAALQVFQEMRVILLTIDGGAGVGFVHQQLCKLFPRQQRKPMTNDPDTRRQIRQNCMTAMLTYLDEDSLENIPHPVTATHVEKLCEAFVRRGNELSQLLEADSEGI